MNTIYPKIAGAAALFLVVILSGFWVARTGRPYPLFIFTIHKLIALAAVILLGRLIFVANHAAPFAPGQWLAVTVTAGCLAALIITGALLSLQGEMPTFVNKIHQVLPYLAAGSLGFSLYLLRTA